MKKILLCLVLGLSVVGCAESGPIERPKINTGFLSNYRVVYSTGGSYEQVFYCQKIETNGPFLVMFDESSNEIGRISGSIVVIPNETRIPPPRPKKINKTEKES